MIKYTNDHGKECWKDCTAESPFDAAMFHEVKTMGDYRDEDEQYALHTNLGSLTVLDRMTGFGWRDIETGYRDIDGQFWLASGNMDVRCSWSPTLGDAIAWVKRNANTCVPDQESEE